MLHVQLCFLARGALLLSLHGSAAVAASGVCTLQERHAPVGPAVLRHVDCWLLSAPHPPSGSDLRE